MDPLGFTAAIVKAAGILRTPRDDHFDALLLVGGGDPGVQPPPGQLRVGHHGDGIAAE